MCDLNVTSSCLNKIVLSYLLLNSLSILCHAKYNIKELQDKHFIRLEDNSFYNGQIENGKVHGKGRLYYPNGDEYFG